MSRYSKDPSGAHSPQHEGSMEGDFQPQDMANFTGPPEQILSNEEDDDKAQIEKEYLELKK